MVACHQSHGWPVKVVLLSSLLLFGGCEEFSASDPNAGPPEMALGRAETKPATSDAATGADTGETVEMTVYMDGVAIDTITVPRSLVDASSPPSSETAQQTSTEDPAPIDTATVADAGDDAAAVEEPAGDSDVSAEDVEVIAANPEAEESEKPAIPEILLERERAIAAQIELNAEVEQQMDWLSDTLGQQTVQLPPLSPPAVAGQYPIYLTRDEAKWQMEQAVVLSQSGDFKGALDLLTVNQCDALDFELYDAWLRMKNELAALYFDSLDVTPLAARMTALALFYHPDSTVRVIRDDLRRDWAWAWRYEGRTRVMEALFSLTPDPEGLLPDSLLAIEGYSNVGLPTDLLSTDRPLEHYHYAVYLMDAEYLLSYSLQSRELSGTGRIYFLERRLGDDPEVLFVYPYLPDYWTMLNEVRVHLEQSQQ